MKLFKKEGYDISISNEALLLAPFKRIWKRDRSDRKEKALSELGFIYFYCDPRSPYSYLIDDEERLNEIIQGEGLKSTWKPDDAINEGIELYKKLTQTTASLLLEDTKYAVEKLRKQIRDIDLTKVDDKGKLVYTLSNITSTIKQIPDLATELMKAEKAITQDLEENTRMRGQGEKKVMEDGFNF